MINVAQLINAIFDIVYLLLMVRILLSWIPHNRYNSIVSVLYQLTDPILRPFQNIIPTTMGFDVSPILAFIFLGILKNVIFRLI